MWLNSEATQNAETLITSVLNASPDSHNIFTPFALCKEVVNKIPSLTGKVLVVANIEFIYTLIQEGVDASNIYFTTPCAEKASVAGMLINDNNIFVCEGVLNNEELQNMKFDVVVGNPPYQAPGKENATKLWPQFIKKSFETLCLPNGIVSLITPKKWLINGMWKKYFISNQIHHLNIDQCKHHFPGVHSSFSYFIVQLQPASQSFTIETSEGRSDVAVQNIPQDGAEYMYSGLLGKVIHNRDYFPMITSSGYNTSGFSSGKDTLSRTKTDIHKHFIIHKISHAKNQTTGFWASTLDRKTFGIPRVVVGLWLSDWKRERMIVSTELLTSQQFRHFPTNSLDESEHLKGVLSSKLYTYILYNLVDGNSSKSSASGSLTNHAVTHFPVVDLTRSWTDRELYTHFNLTQEEINLIEETIK